MFSEDEGMALTSSKPASPPQEKGGSGAQPLWDMVM